MVKRVFNMGGGAHSDAAYTAFENAAYGSCVANATSLAVSAGGGMSVRIAAGDGIISTPSSGKRIQSDAVETVTISAANATYSRIDSVVVYIDSSVQPNTAVIDNVNGILKFAAVAGTPAANPIAPTESMIQAAIGVGNGYMVLADVRVPNGATSMNTATFIDRRKVATMVDGNNIAKKAVKADNIDFATFPMFRAVATTDQLFSNSIFTPAIFSSKEYDNTNSFNGTVFTAPITGYYRFDTSISFSVSKNARAIARFVVDNDNKNRIYDGQSAGSSGIVASGGLELALSAGQQVKVECWEAAGNGLSAENSFSWFSGRLVSL